MTNFSARIGSVMVGVELGNLTDKKVDAYIVPQFKSGASFGGVGGAVARGGAAKGLDKFQEYIDAHGEQPFGQVVVTPSFGGNSKTLLHVVSVASQKENEFETVRTSIYNTLKEAEKQGVATIAAPALGTGIIGQLTNEQSAKAMMAAINDYASGGGKPLAIAFVIWDGNRDAQQAFSAFKGVLESGSYKNVDREVGGRKIDLVRWFNEMSSDATSNAEAAKNPTAPVAHTAPATATFRKKTP